VGGVPESSARDAYYLHLFRHPDFRQGATGQVNAAEHYRHATMYGFPYRTKREETGKMPQSH
jgi:hypothetical protein